MSHYVQTIINVLPRHAIVTNVGWLKISLRFWYYNDQCVCFIVAYVCMTTSAVIQTGVFEQAIPTFYSQDKLSVIITVQD